MISNLIKKIWLICLWLTSLSLVGCFHVPDEDWLPSRNKVNTWDTQRDKEIDQALNSFMDWINIISSDWDELKNKENDEITEEWEENTIEMEDEAINDEIADEDVENEEVQDDTTSGE